MLLWKSYIKTHPDLRVKLVGKERLNMLTEFRLRLDVAQSFRISRDRVEWETE